MLFNSLEFLVFFLCVYAAYWLLNHRWQNCMLLAASYFFYGSWNWRCLSLILVSTSVAYLCAIKISESASPRRRKGFLVLSLAVDLGILGFFKYFNFFASSLSELLAFWGLPPNAPMLSIILPVGISFYTFQSLSYTIDVYRKEITATPSFADFALFIAFFPQLVAGPIERARHLLPQIASPRKFEWSEFRKGCFFIAWGLYQKIFIADNLCRFVDPIFQDPVLYSGHHVLLALYAFAFQIYCDFAGYSNIARGLGRLMGFDIMANFNAPYLATNPREFWQRWHISLSTWLRDYLYIPLGGNRLGLWRTYGNIFLVMLLGGLWHGANWTFVLWGVYHALLLMGHRLLEPLARAFSARIENGLLKQGLRCLQRVFFFHLVCAGWLLFRAESLNEALAMAGILFSSLSFPAIELVSGVVSYLYLVWIMDLAEARHASPLAVFGMKRVYRWVIYAAIFVSLAAEGMKIHEGFLLGEMPAPKQFIYFQF
jgi:D-alanyl-lipoteichoic acid acyltransferase DltB (MBOAT superfamily)